MRARKLRRSEERRRGPIGQHELLTIGDGMIVRRRELYEEEEALEGPTGGVNRFVTIYRVRS